MKTNLRAVRLFTFTFFKLFADAGKRLHHVFMYRSLAQSQFCGYLQIAFALQETLVENVSLPFRQCRHHLVHISDFLFHLAAMRLVPFALYVEE